ncbi:MAG: tetratricopeptide repeat protein, partial [Candidatus Hodarchaeales archaeon]
ILVQDAIAMLYQVKASCYGLYLGDYERGIELGKKALALAESISSPDTISWAYYIISAIYQHKEDVALGLEYAEKGKKIAQEKDFKIPLGLIHITLGRIYGIKGNNSKLVEYMNEAYRIGKETGNNVITNLTTGEIGSFYASKGLYDQAIVQFNLGLQLAKERDDTFVIIKRLNDLGEIYHIRGELSQALNSFRECLVLSPKIKNRFFESRMYYALGSVHFDQGTYENASEMFMKSQSILSTLAPHSLLYSSILYALVMLNLELQQVDKANYCLKQLETIAIETINEKIRLNYQLAKALMLKASPRLKNRVKAQEIFENIGETTGIEHSIVTFALLNKCDLLISEYKSTGEKEILNEIMELSQRLYLMGQEENAYPTIIKALLLQSKLFLIEGSLEKLEGRLNEAFNIAESKNLGSLLNQINHEQEKVRTELVKWKALLTSNASIQERFSAAALDNYINSVKQLVNYKQQEELDE